MRSVYFSFHYDRDILRIGRVRNSWLTQPKNRATSQFLDKADWEEVKKKDTASIERWINDQIDGTSVTVVLIGAQTSTRPWVKYEIKQSYLKNHGMLGIYIHKIKGLSGYVDTKGANPFGAWQVNIDGKTTSFSEIYPTYDWVDDDGYNNMPSWIEKAAKIAGK